MRADSAALRVPLESARAQRWGHQRVSAPNEQGQYYCATADTLLRHESKLERSAMMLADRDPAVIGLSCQPVEFVWPKSAAVVTHVPDLFVRRRRGVSGLVDVHAPVRTSGGEFALQRALTNAACGDIGWSYDVFTGIGPVFEANLYWLGAYRHKRFAPSDAVLDDVRDAYRGGAPLSEGISGLQGGPESVLPWVYHLMWSGVLRFDWEAPLRMWTAVYTSDFGGDGADEKCSASG
ncbi:TnsA-like heteromeric transposase endonuclease subunit [Rhodococcus sp. ACT016]|uniref:TnsA-like heteromeric transposase endonuclease subunit n=1 Tax=Rhodococcus sp. ACT016 TaxID=3134808 RepID=UPI003D27CAE9